MSELTFVEPEKPVPPFAVGDAVEVLDRDGSVLSARNITGRDRDGNFKTDCGRWWTQSGWWIGQFRAWPFPSIRHATLKSQGASNE